MVLGSLLGFFVLDLGVCALVLDVGCWLGTLVGTLLGWLRVVQGRLRFMASKVVDRE